MRYILKLFGVMAAISAPLSHAHAERIFGLTEANKIVTFDSATPGVITSSGGISGLGTDKLTGIDLRPVNRALYSVSTSGNVYKISKDASGSGYTATLSGNIATSLPGTRFGIDFNPVPDRIRLIGNADTNLRINPDTALTIADTMITGPGSIALIGAAYTNNRAGALTTVLYALDAEGSELLRSTNPNAGTYVNTNLAGVAFGPLGVLIGRRNLGFDISGLTGAAFFNSGGQFYSLDLASGAASSIGSIGAGSLVGAAQRRHKPLSVAA